MHTSVNVHGRFESRVRAQILTLPNGGRVLTVEIASPNGDNPVTIFGPPEFFDKLANEAERGVREFVGDVPAPSQEYLDGLGELQSREALR